jgi:hypothetical protein
MLCLTLAALLTHVSLHLQVAQLQQDLSDFCSTYIPETITTTTANASPSTSPTTTPTTTAPTQAHLQSHQVALRLLVQCVVLGVSPSPSTVSRLWEALQPHLPVLPPEELVEVTWAMSALNRVSDVWCFSMCGDSQCTGT